MIDTGRTIYFNKSFYLKKSYFYKSLGIRPKSYIGKIISRIHDYYFKNSCLLKKIIENITKKNILRLMIIWIKNIIFFNMKLKI